MTEYLSYTFEDSTGFVETFDELPLWSAPFGLLLLKHIPLMRNSTVIDIGSGAGFPLTELASRLGNACKVYGIDPWANANDRARKKIHNYGLRNVEIVEGSATTIPLPDECVDLIVSNLGINNFDDPVAVFRGCHRVLKPRGKLALTTNLNGHWKAFYNIFEDVLQETGNDKLMAALAAHQEHRGSVGSISTLFTQAGFALSQVQEESFNMRFLDGSAFLNHHFIKLGWLGSWKALVPNELQARLFGQIEERLNELAAHEGALTLTVPMAYIEGVK